MAQGGLNDELAARAAQTERERQMRVRSQPGRLWGELRGRRYLDLSVDSQFSDAWLVLAALLTLLGLWLRQPFLLTASLGLFLVAAIGWAWNSLALFGVDYRRHLSETRAFVGETIRLTLEVHNRKFLPTTWLQVKDIFPVALPLAGEQVRLNQATQQGEFTSFWSLGAFERVRRELTIHCAQRGYHFYGPARVSTGDAFGMFGRRGTLPGRVCLIVYPRIYTAAELELPAKNPFGERLSVEPLFEDPLRTAGIRTWQPADGLKRLHWKATARHLELLSRLYEPSEEPQVLIFLNVATMARHWLGNYPELQELAISVAGSLAALCAEQRLPVGLIANGFLPESDQPLRLLPGRSPNQLLRILELLAAVTPFATGAIEELILREAPRLPWGATLLVVTAVAHEELLATLATLARAGRRLVLVTLAERPPTRSLPGVIVYHLPHLAGDVVAPQRLS